MQINIYKLVDPRDELKLPRYIGITRRKLKYRLSGHINKKLLEIKSHKTSWIKSLLKEGITPEIILLGVIDNWEEACKVERYYIKEAKRMGYSLTNTAEGGEGGTTKGINRTPRTEETKNKIRNTLLNHSVSTETREKIKRGLLGNKLSQKTINKLRLLREKPVIFTYDNGNIIKYDSIQKCTLNTGITRHYINKYIKTCNGRIEDKKVTISYQSH